MSARWFITAALAATTLSSPVAAQDFAITGATIALGDGSEPIANGTVIVRGGKIAAAGAGVAVPADIQSINGQGLWVTPGIFEAVTDLGLFDVDAVGQSNDQTARESRFNAALDVSPVINPGAQNIKVSRAAGVTRASVTPEASTAIFAGQGAVIDLGADANPVTQARAFQYVELGEDGGDLAGGSRTAAYAEFYNALAEARDLAANPGRQDDALLTRPDALALIPVVTGKQKLYVEAERTADIRSIVRLKREFPQLDLVLVGATEGWTLANEIAASGIPVVAVALNDLPVSFEQLAATQSNVGRMVQAGVKVALGRYSGDRHARAPQHAGNLVALGKMPGAAGLTWGQALASITSVPAEISGMGGKAGVLKAGAVGDLVIWDGDPLEVSSAPQRVFIDGVEQPLDSHQTRLRDRYRTPAPGELPKAYDW